MNKQNWLSKIIFVIHNNNVEYKLSKNEGVIENVN